MPRNSKFEQVFIVFLMQYMYNELVFLVLLKTIMKFNAPQCKTARLHMYIVRNHPAHHVNDYICV